MTTRTIFGTLVVACCLIAAGKAQAATLQLSPASNAVSVGDTVTVNVLLDTQGQAIDGVDLHYLNYNPYYLQLQDADSNTAGTQIKSGTLMPNTLTNSVDTVNGKVDFSQLTSSGNTYTGSGILATLTFKALAAGTSNITLDYTSGATTDTNVASAGSDILSSVTNSQVTIGYSSAPVSAGTPNAGSSTGTTPVVTPGNSGSSIVHLKLINYKGTYYLIIDGVRHGITLPGILFSYGFALNQAKVATDIDMALPEGDILVPGDGVLAKTATDKTVWLISGNQRHGFTSATVFTDLGFKFSQVLVVTAPELNRQARGSNVDDATKAHLPGINVSDNGTIYWIDYNNTKHAYPSLTVYNSWNVPNDFSRVLPANAADKALPTADPVAQRTLE